MSHNFGIDENVGKGMSFCVFVHNLQKEMVCKHLLITQDYNRFYHRIMYEEYVDRTHMDKVIQEINGVINVKFLRAHMLLYTMATIQPLLLIKGSHGISTLVGDQ